MMLHKWMFSFLPMLFIFVTAAFAQTGSVVLKDTTGTVISSHNSVISAYNAIVAPMTQAYVIELLTAYDGSNETYPIVLTAKAGSSSSNYIIIRPAAGNTGEVISGSVSTPIITFDDADNIIIDGRPGGLGTEPDLSIRNLSTASGGFTLRLLNGSVGNIIRYVKVENSTANVAGPRAIEFGTSVNNISGNSNNLVSHCKITGGRSGIGFAGTAANPNTDNVVEYCEISNFGYAAVWLLGGSQSTRVENCTIYQVSSSTSSLMYGFNIGASGAGKATIIRKNKIYDIQSTSTSTSLAIRGIYAAAANLGSLVIENNFISLTKSNQNATVIGIHLFGTTDYSASVLYNTIRIGGAHGSGILTGVGSCGIYKVFTGDTSAYVQKNNICINERTGGAGVHIGSYIDTSFSQLTVDYNTYFSTGTSSPHAAYNGQFFTDLTAYQAAAAPHEANSKFYGATFVSETDLHLAGSSIGDNNLSGTPIAEVTTDIDNEVRSSMNPYMGADEGNIPLTTGPSILVTAPNGGEVWVVGATKNITWNSRQVSNVTITYTTDNGSTWLPIAASVTASNGVYAWIIPNTPSLQCKVKIADAGTDTIKDLSNSVFTISTVQILTIPMNVTAGWNMVSVPVIAADMSGSVLFSGANSQIFGYNNGYITQTTLANGKGYWVRYAAPATFSISGTEVSEHVVPVTAGWNMIGGFNYNTPVDGISSTPPGIVNSFYFGFDNGYTQAVTLNSGKGYWVRCTSAGTLTLAVPTAKNNSSVQALQYGKDWGRLIFSDALGRTSTLYVAGTGSNVEQYSLPPVPPAGCFDVRYSSGSSAEILVNRDAYVSISGAAFPIKVHAEGVDLQVRDAQTGGKIFSGILSSGSEVQLSDSGVEQLVIANVSQPVVFMLEQNYPNPFNPSTTISFSVPEKAHVQITVYNQLGQQVEILVGGEQEAGYHSVAWNAADMPSGTYFVEMRAAKYKSVKKIMLLK